MLALALLASACNDSKNSNGSAPAVPPAMATFSVGGSVNGLAPGGSLTLQNNGGDDLVLTANGSFTFATALPDGAAFAVAVLTQPRNANCVVTGGTGTLAGATVTTVVVTCTPTSAAPGELDPSFNPGGAQPGIVVDGLSGLGSSAGLASTVDANGRILVTGHATGMNLDMALWRFNADGSVDTSFNAGGAVPGLVTHASAAGGSGTDQGRAIAIDASGRILVAGLSRGPFNFDMALWRFLPNGTLDTSFNALGPEPGVVVSFGAAGGNGSEQADAILIDANGRILVAGGGASVLNNAFTDMVVWRFDADGTLDTTFNAAGALPGIFSFNAAAAGAGNESATALALDATNRIIVAGAQDTLVGIAIAVWRLEASGVLDTSLDAGGALPGRITIDVAPDNINHAEGVVVDANGKLVVAGSSGAGAVSDLVLVRWNADGSLDGSFNALGFMPGVVFHNNAAGGNAEDSSASLVLDAMGRLVVAGGSQRLAGDFDLAVWRFEASGALDTSFNAGGVLPGVFTHHNAAGGAGADFGQSVCFDNLGRLVVAGSSVNPPSGPGTTTRMTLWRLNP